jgi:hypothetical protein
MAESAAQALRVKVIRGGEPSPGIVQDPREVPWTVVEDPSQAEVRWTIIVFLPAPEPLVFESVHELRTWVGRDERASGMNWDLVIGPPPPSDADSIERNKEATRRYLDFATQPENQGLSPAEVFRRAHEKKIIGSLALYEDFGCTGRCYVVEGYLPDWSLLGYSWSPRSCLIYGQGALFTQANKGGETSQVSGPSVCIDLPFLPQAAEVQ